jgi:hypothetical protein
MPELNGQPFKNELRAEIRDLKNRLWVSQQENCRKGDQLRFAKVKIEELEAKIQRMEHAIRSALGEATQEIDFGQKYVESISKRFAKTH